jgi:hypothetical protein
MDPTTAHDFSRYLRGAQAEVQAGVVSSRADAASVHWAIWEQFCHRFSLDPTLQGIKDPVPILQAFAHAYRHGHVNPIQVTYRSGLAPWKMQYVPLAKRLPQWGPRTHA